MSKILAVVALSVSIFSGPVALTGDVPSLGTCPENLIPAEGFLAQADFAGKKATDWNAPKLASLYWELVPVAALRPGDLSMKVDSTSVPGTVLSHVRTHEEFASSGCQQ